MSGLSGSESSSDETELSCRDTGHENGASYLTDFFEFAERSFSDLVVCFGSFSYGITTYILLSNFFRLFYCVLLTFFETYSVLYACKVVNGRFLGY